MRIVKAVIGMVHGLIQLVGRVPQVQAILNGGNSNIVVDTQPPQPAKTTRKRKPKPAQVVTKVASQKPVHTTAKQTPIQRGNKQVTPVQQSSGQKRKSLPAQSTKVVKSPNKERSQQTLQGRGKQSVTPAPKTPRHAKSAPKRKP